MEEKKQVRAYIKHASKKEARAYNNAKKNFYNKTYKTSFCFKFHNEKDKDVIEKLNSVSNKNDYIRTLILNDINK